MTTKRNMILALMATGAGLAASLGKTGDAQAEIAEDAAEALQGWTDAVFTGDPAVVEKVLAPEFQIQRSDGTGFNKADYLGALPKQKTKSTNSDVIATGHGDVMVVRYIVHSDQTIDGKQVEAISPRLGVFRKEDGRWLLLALANFAKIG